MAQINPYLNFKGDCEEAFNFYKSVFGGEFPFVSRYSDMPPSENGQSMNMDGNKIMHISLPISKETILMGSDVGEKSATDQGNNDNFQLSVSVESEDEAHKIFDGLSVGGQVKMALEKTFWGALFGMFTDKFGINWIVNYDYKKEE